MITLKTILSNKGATLTREGEAVKLESGYQVSVRDMEIIPVHKLLKRRLVELLQVVPKGHNLGIWIYNGKAYIDISKTYKRRGYAMRIGVKNKQITIWDWKNRDEVVVQED